MIPPDKMIPPAIPRQSDASDFEVAGEGGKELSALNPPQKEEVSSAASAQEIRKIVEEVMGSSLKELRNWLSEALVVPSVPHASLAQDSSPTSCNAEHEWASRPMRRASAMVPMAARDTEAHPKQVLELPHGRPHRSSDNEGRASHSSQSRAPSSKASPCEEEGAHEWTHRHVAKFKSIPAKRQNDELDDLSEIRSSSWARPAASRRDLQHNDIQFQSQVLPPFTSQTHLEAKDKSLVAIKAVDGQVDAVTAWMEPCRERTETAAATEEPVVANLKHGGSKLMSRITGVRGEFRDRKKSSAATQSFGGERRRSGGLFGSIIIRVVTHNYFDTFVCSLIVLNAALIGYQIEYATSNLTIVVPTWSRAVEVAFCILFVAEVGMRLYVYGWKFFNMFSWKWNVFDLAVVGLQVIEEAGNAIMTSFETGIPQGFSFIRVLRILRLVRILRIVRILRLISELRTLVFSIMESMKALGWTVLLLVVMIYTLSLYFTQLVADHQLQSDQDEDLSNLTHYFGSLGTTMISMFQAISGGIDWDGMLRPLLDEISPWSASVFVVYVAFSDLALMNVITGVFVESVLKSTKADKDMFLMSNARELFQNLKGGPDCLMTWDIFQDNLTAPQMQEFFKAIDVDPSEARGLFNLLDMDESGAITAEEFLNGCLRLRGPASALDLALLLHEVKQVPRRVGHHHHHSRHASGFSSHREHLTLAHRRASSVSSTEEFGRLEKVQSFTHTL